MKADIQRRKKHISPGHILIIIVLVLMALFILIPFWNAVVISFMPAHEVARHPGAMIPYGFSLQNYKTLIEKGGLLAGYKNTLIMTVCGTVYGMTISTMMAYAFSQNFPGKRFFFIMIIFTMYFSGGTVPMYLLLKRLGLLNHLSGVILMHGVSAWNVIVIKNGFENTPPALVEAGKIDGANDWRIFWQIMLPLQKPVIATFSLFTAVGYWNEWFWSTLTLSEPGTQPLMVYLRNIVNTIDTDLMNFTASIAYTQNSNPQGVKMAAVFCTMLPIMCMYPFLQKYFMKGITIGAVKM